jgi:ATP-binding cassette subfamily B protein
MTEDASRESISTVYEDTIENTNPIIVLLRQYIPGRLGVFGVAVISTILHCLIDLVPPYLLGITINAFFTEQNGSLSIAFVPSAWIPATTRGQFTFLAGLFVITALVKAGTHLVQFVTFRWFQQSALHDLRTDVYDATQRLDLMFFNTEETGDVMSVLNNDINQLQDVLFGWLRQSIEFGTLLLGLCLVMLGLHCQLTLLTMSFIPLMLSLVYAYQRVIEPRYDSRRSAVGTLNTHIQNAISGIETIKAFGTEHRERSRLRTHSRSFWQADWSAAKISGLFYPTRDFLTEVASLTIVIVGGWWALFGPPFMFTDPVTTGTFVTFLFYGRWLVNQSSAVGDLVDTYTDAKASAKRVFGLIYYPTTVIENDDAIPLDPVNGRVVYRDVTFTYPTADSPSLQDVSFEANAGDFIGIVGPTGAGKSTILKLLPRFYDPDEGTITIDGTDSSQTTLESLRTAIGYVSQEPFLFDRTVRENIAYDTPDVSEKRVIEAAKCANAHTFIQDLPEMYDTEVGERGMKLSGGQRQRIAIARTILRDPDILLLDETTSHVDNRTELLIHDNLTDIVAGRTTFVIAHRLSTVRQADQILVLDDREIIERGTHEELLAEDGVYADLWRIHVGESESIPEHSLEQLVSSDDS